MASLDAIAAAAEEHFDDPDRLNYYLPGLDGPDSPPVIVLGWKPTTEQLLMFAAAREDRQRFAGALVALLGGLLEEEDFQDVVRRLNAKRNDPTRIGLAELMPVIELAMESVSGFPTEPSSDSSGSQTRTGRSSTAQPRKTGRARSTSASGASAT